MILHDELEKELGEKVEILEITDGRIVDFKTLDGIKYWAKLTKNYKVKKHSIRILAC
jgi:HKD family nuclease